MNAPTPLTQTIADALQVGRPPACLVPTGRLPADVPLGPLTTAELEEAVRCGADRERYRRIWHGMYRREDQADGLRLRGLALARKFPESVLRGRSAALLWGDDSAPADAMPEIWLPSTRKSRPERVYRYGAMPREAVTVVDGLRVTTPLRTCRDLAADLPHADAVVAFERMIAAQPELEVQVRAAAEHPSGRSAHRFVTVVEAMDPRAASMEESRARQLLLADGLDGFGYGHEIRSNRRSLLLPLADPTFRCVVFTRTAWLGWSEGSQTALREAGWSVVVIRGSASPSDREAAAARTRGSALSSDSEDAVGSLRVVGPGDGPDDGFGAEDAGVVTAAVLRSWWPETGVLEPVEHQMAVDPLGMWAS